MLELLEVLRVQRHDFLNHLQVISGLIQLKKYDRAGEYVRQVGEELSRAGFLARLGCKPIVAEVLLAQLKAHKMGISFECSVNSGMEAGVDNEEALAQVLRQIFETAIDLVEVSSIGHGSINFEIGQINGQYLFQTGLRIKKGMEDSLNNSIAVLKEAARNIGGTFDTGNSDSDTISFTLKIPVKS